MKNTATGFGQRIRADQPLARINFWSIRTNVSWEPYIAIDQAGRDQALDLYLRLFRPRQGMKRAALAALLVAGNCGGPAGAARAGTETTPVSDALATAPQVTLTNGQLAARVALPDLANGFYRGTRFDQAGVITSLTLNGREFYGPWFERTAPDVLDYIYVARRHRGRPRQRRQRPGGGIRAPRFQGGSRHALRQDRRRPAAATRRPAL